MIYCPIFRISGSIIKPSRETLLDYCSYCLIVIALIGTARIWIGGSGMTQGCPLFENATGIAGMGSNADSNSYIQHESSISVSNDFEQQPSITEGSAIAGKINRPKEDTVEEQNAKCAKYYQSVFAYILLVESSVLLFSGLIWTKLPRVSQSIDKFCEVLEACRNSSWSKKALGIINNDRGPTGDVSQSLYSIVSSESVPATHNVRSFLDHLFRSDNDYKAKSNARHLYEKVVIFCEQYSQSTSVWSTYIMKSLVQFLLWLIIFNINLVLFVHLELYIVCPEEDSKSCKHDMFLRIIWFMAQTVILIYAVFMCKTVMWINEKSVVKQSSCCCCRFFSNYRISHTDGNVGQKMTCKPYRFADNPPVYNDAALMLHLLEEAHPQCIPPFVIFMFPEWKEKLTSFSTPAYDTASLSTIQMISRTPSVTVSIIDVTTPNDKQRKRNPSGKRKAQVKFSVTEDAELPPANIDNELSQNKVIDTNSISTTRPKEFVQQPSAKLHFVRENSKLLPESSSSENIECAGSQKEESNNESDTSETRLIINGV